MNNRNSEISQRKTKYDYQWRNCRVGRVGKVLGPRAKEMN